MVVHSPVSRKADKESIISRNSLWRTEGRVFLQLLAVMNFYSAFA